MATEPTVKATLRTVRGDTPAPAHEIGRESTVLGRAPGCDVVLDRNTVSKRHARIERRADGYYLEDLESRSKTFLDGKPVARPERLRDGSRIEICDFRFVFSLPTVAVEDDGGSTVLGLMDATAADAGATTVRSREKLRALMEINRALAGTLGLAGVLATVLDALFRVFPQADRGFVVFKPERDAGLVPSAIKVRDGDPGRLTISRTVFDLVLGGGRAVLSEDAPAEFDTAKSIVDSRVITLMAVPLLDRLRRPAGILQLDTRDRRGRFGADDLDLLTAVSDLVGVAAENARLHEVEVRQGALDREARDARAVQLALMPARGPALAGYEFWHSYEPARFVGGDYYDYVSLSAPGGPADRWAVALGDVEGKGMAAALLTTRLSAEVRRHLGSEPDPAAVVTRLNRELCESGTAGKLITFLLTVVDGSAHRLAVVSAGHMGPVVRRGDGRVEVVGEDEGGLVLCVEGCETYRAADTALGQGDVVVLYTDGVSEATDADGRQFGAGRLAEALSAAPAGAAAAGEAILRSLREHTAGCPQGDDITLLCFGRV